MAALALGGAGRCATRVAAQVDALLARDYPIGAPGAAAMVCVGGRTVLRKGYGTADLARGGGVPADGEFRVASITKEFTAAAVLQLVAAGKVRLDDDVRRYLPWVDTGSREVIVRELLDHTSGLTDYSDLEAFRAGPALAPLTVRQIWGLAAGRGLRFAPGTDWEYCNTGYVLLGALIERVSGEPYGEYLRRRVFGPAGMAHTFYDDPRWSGGAAGSAGPVGGVEAARERVPGYSRAGDRWVPAAGLAASRAFAAGGVVSTVDDLWRWERALEAGRVVPAELVAEARTPARLLGSGARVGYGLGWELGYVDGVPVVGHGGQMSGYRSYMVAMPSRGVFVVLLCNADRPAVDPMDAATEVVRVLLDGGLRATAPSGDGGWARYAGVYRVDDTRKLWVRAGGRSGDGEPPGSGLVAEETGEDPVRLVAAGPGVFVDPASGSWYRFRLGADGQGKAAAVELRPRVGVDQIAPRVAENFEGAAVAVAPGVLRGYVGRYRGAFGRLVAVEEEGGALWLRVGEEDPSRLVAETSARFRLEDRPEEAVEFLPSGSGAAEVVLSVDRPIVTAERME